MPDVGPTPPIDRLIVVSHDAEIAVPLRQLLHEQVLRGIGILEFVDQHVLKPVLPVRETLRVLAEQGERMEQEVIEIHRVRLLERGSYLDEDVRRDLDQRRIGPGAELLRREHAAGTATGRIQAGKRSF